MNNTVYCPVDFRVDTQRRVTHVDILREFALNAGQIDLDPDRPVRPSPGMQGYFRAGLPQFQASRLPGLLPAGTFRVSDDFYLK